MKRIAILLLALLLTLLFCACDALNSDGGGSDAGDNNQNITPEENGGEAPEAPDEGEAPNEGGEEIPHTHVFGDWRENSASCTSGGVEKRYCECGYFETQSTEKLGHSADGGTYSITRPSTCSSEGEGKTVYSCTVCAAVLREVREPIPVTEHVIGNTREEMLAYPTCTEVGAKRISKICDGCGQTVESITESIPTVEHIAGESVRETVKEPTCTAQGQYRDCVYCTECNRLLNESIGTLSKLGHDYSQTVSTVVTEPTCTSAGKAEEYKLCTRCGAKANKKTVSISKLEHTPLDPVREDIPTACEYYMVSYCAFCGIEMSREYVNDDPSMHTPGEPVVTTLRSPGCNATGSAREDTYCVECSYLISSVTVTLEKTAHTPGSTTTRVIKPATCTETGISALITRCSKCKAEMSSEEYETPTVDHSYGKENTSTVLEATCVADGYGYKYKTCYTCSYEMITEEFTIDAYGHTEKQSTENKTEPTCAAVGGYDTVITCTDCGTELSRKHTTLPAKGHTPHTEPVTENVTAPTCTEVGSYDTVIYCLVCAAQCSRTTTYTDALGHTPNGEVKIEKYVASTCSALGSYDAVEYCSVCSEEATRVQKIVEMLPHTYSLYTCVDCGHKAVCNEGAALLPTSDGSGYVLESCKNCSDDVIYVTTHDGLPIVEISAGAFGSCGAHTVIIGDSVVKIGESAFNSSAIEHIEVSPRNTAFKLIGESLYTADGTLIRFISNNEKADIVIDDSFPDFYAGAFDMSDDIRSVTVNGKISAIADWLFENCTALEAVVINTPLTGIGYHAFYGCSALSELKLNATVESIGIGAFESCASLKSLVIPDGIQLIDIDAFYSCTSLEVAVLGESLTYLPAECFGDCTSLKEVLIPSTLMKIAHFAFTKTDLQTVYYRGDAESWKNISIGVNGRLDEAYRCYYLESKPLMPGDYWHFVDGLPQKWPPIPEGEGTKGLEYQINDDLLTYTVVGFRGAPDDVVIPSTYNDMPVVAIVPKGAGYPVKSLVIPDSITKISSDAFSGWSHLESVTWPSTVTEIPDFAFMDCKSLSEIVIPEGVTKIGDWAFASCTSLIRVTLPSTLSEIGEDAFYDTDYLYEICNGSPLVIEAGSTHYGDISLRARNIFKPGEGEFNSYVGADMAYYSDDEITVLIRYSAGESDVVLPDLINGKPYRVSADAFYSMDMKSIYISSGVIELEDVTLSTSLESIEVSPGNAVYTSYDGCLYTKDMSILLCCPGMCGKTLLTVPDGVREIGDYAVMTCRDLNYIVLPDSVTRIGTHAFFNCEELLEVDLGEGLQYIGSSAFAYCYSLTKLVVPASITYISTVVFDGCSNLTVYFEIDAAPDTWHKNWNKGDATYIFGYSSENEESGE